MQRGLAEDEVCVCMCVCVSMCVCLCVVCRHVVVSACVCGFEASACDEMFTANGPFEKRKCLHVHVVKGERN